MLQDWGNAKWSEDGTKGPCNTILKVFVVILSTFLQTAYALFYIAQWPFSSRADGAVFQGLFYQTLAPWENQIESTCWSEWFLQGLASNSVKGNTSPWELTYLPVERIPLEDIERLKGLRALSYKRPKNDSDLEGRALQRTESYSLGSPQLHSLS